MGIVTGVLGLLSGLAALNSFADTCFRSLGPKVSYISMTKTPGAAFILLLVATILKLVDIFAHVIVPVPATGFWSPNNEIEDSSEVEDGKAKQQQASLHANLLKNGQYGENLKLQSVTGSTV